MAENEENPGGDAPSPQPSPPSRRPPPILVLGWLLAGIGFLLLAYALRGDGSPGGPDGGVQHPDAARVPTGTARLVVTVEDDSGETLEGATVTLEMRFDDGAPLVREVRTDAHGLTELRGLPEGDADVFAIAPGRARGHIRVRVQGREARAQLSLVEGQTVRGEVVDEVGEPVTQAAIEATSVADETAPPWKALTDDQGVFVLDHLQKGAQRILVRAEGYDEIARRVAPFEVEARDGEEPPTLRIVLHHTGMISGHVTGSDGGPGDRTRIVLVGSGVWPARSAEADSEGHYQFEGVPEGIYEISARRDTEVAAPREGLILEPGESLEVDLALEPGLALSGVLLSAEDATPIAGADVVIGEQTLSFTPRATTTDEEGRFSFEGLRAMTHRLDIHAPGWVSMGNHTAEPGGEPLRILLAKEAIVSGVVVDALDHPVAGAEIELVGTADDGTPVALSGADASFQAALIAAQVRGPTPVDPAGDLGVTLGAVPPIPIGPGLVPGGPSPSALSPGETTEAGDTEPEPLAEDSAALMGFSTDAEGRFEIHGIPAGRYQVVGRHPAHAPGIGEPFVIHTGEHREDERLVLPAGATIDGRVVDGRGFPVAQVRVEMHCEREPFPRWALSADDGTFGFEGALDTCVFSAYPAAQPAARKTLTIEGGDAVPVELALSDEVDTFRGRVMDEDGFPIAGARVSLRSLRPDAPARRTAFSNDDGTIEIGGMPAPPWRAEVDQEGYALEVFRRIDDAEGEHRLTLHPAATVIGRVVDGWDDTPVIGAKVSLLRGGTTAFETVSDDTGTFEIPRVAAGDYTALVEASGLLSHRAPVSLRATRQGLEDLDLGDISLEAGGGIQGVVVDALSSPIGGARVVAGPAGDPLAEARSDDAGAFALDGLPPGDIPVVASHPGAGTSEPLTVRVRAREVIPGAVLRLPDRFDAERAESAGGGRRTGVQLVLGRRGGSTVIRRVPADGAAAAAGLARGDVITSIDDEAVTSPSQADVLLRGPAGTEVLVTVERRGQRSIIAVERESYEE